MEFISNKINAGILLPFHIFAHSDLLYRGIRVACVHKLNTVAEGKKRKTMMTPTKKYSTPKR